MEFISPETVDEGILNSFLNFPETNESNNSNQINEINHIIATDEANTNTVENTSLTISAMQAEAPNNSCSLKESCLICKNLIGKPKPENWFNVTYSIVCTLFFVKHQSNGVSSSTSYYFTEEDILRVALSHWVTNSETVDQVKSHIRQTLEENGSTFISSSNGWTLVSQSEDLPKEVAKWVGNNKLTKLNIDEYLTSENASFSDISVKSEESLNLSHAVICLADRVKGRQRKPHTPARYEIAQDETTKKKKVKKPKSENGEIQTNHSVANGSPIESPPKKQKIDSTSSQKESNNGLSESQQDQENNTSRSESKDVNNVDQESDEGDTPITQLLQKQLENVKKANSTSKKTKKTSKSKKSKKVTSNKENSNGITKSDDSTESIEPLKLEDSSSTMKQEISSPTSPTSPTSELGTPNSQRKKRRRDHSLLEDANKFISQRRVQSLPGRRTYASLTAGVANEEERIQIEIHAIEQRDEEEKKRAQLHMENLRMFEREKKLAEAKAEMRAEELQRDPQLLEDDPNPFEPELKSLGTLVLFDKHAFFPELFKFAKRKFLQAEEQRREQILKRDEEKKRKKEEHASQVLIEKILKEEGSQKRRTRSRTSM